MGCNSERWTKRQGGRSAGGDAEWTQGARHGGRSTQNGHGRDSSKRAAADAAATKKDRQKHSTNTHTHTHTQIRSLIRTNTDISTLSTGCSNQTTPQVPTTRTAPLRQKPPIQCSMTVASVRAPVLRDESHEPSNRKSRGASRLARKMSRTSFASSSLA